MDCLLLIDGQQHGPYTDAAIKEMLLEGSISSESLYWCEGMSEWKPLQEMAATKLQPPNSEFVEVESSKRRFYSNSTVRKFVAYTFVVVLLSSVSLYVVIRHSHKSPKSASHTSEHRSSEDKEDDLIKSDSETEEHRVDNPTEYKYTHALDGVTVTGVTPAYEADSFALKNQLGQELLMSYYWVSNNNATSPTLRPKLIFDVHFSSFDDDTDTPGYKKAKTCRESALRALNKFVGWTTAAYTNKLGAVAKKLPDDVQFPDPELHWEYVFVADTSKGTYALELQGSSVEPIWHIDYDRASSYQYLFAHWDGLMAHGQTIEPAHEQFVENARAESAKKFFEEESQRRERISGSGYLTVAFCWMARL